MRLLGGVHILLCKIPVVGLPLAAGLSRAFAIFPWLGGVRGASSIEETRQQLKEAGELMDFPFEFSEIEDGEFTLELPYCPYGFNHANHQKPCDAAMEMDRTLLRFGGADLIITDTIPRGAERCRMLIRRKEDDH